MVKTWYGRPRMAGDTCWHGQHNELSEVDPCDDCLRRWGLPRALWDLVRPKGKSRPCYVLKLRGGEVFRTHEGFLDREFLQIVDAEADVIGEHGLDSSLSLRISEIVWCGTAPQ